MNNQLYAKICEGDLKGKTLRVTGQSQGCLTVEYVEECYSLTRGECQPYVNGETLTWEQYDILMGGNK